MNVYADFGRIIKNDRYIKRDKEKTISKKILGKINNSIILTGLGRVGKTTLINYLLKSNLYIYIHMSSIKNSETFYKKIVKEIYKLLSSQLDTKEKIKSILEDFNEEADKSFAYTDFLEEISDLIGDNYIYIILDEFDYVENLLNRNDIQTLRETVINDYYKVVYIFISRRRMEEIEKSIDGVSTLAASIGQEFLECYYNENELESYFKYLSKYININRFIITIYKYFTGYNPYLMDIVSYYLVDENKSWKEVIKIIKKDDKFLEFFQHIIALLELQNLDRVLYSFILKEPIFDETKLDKLNKYGLIKDNKLFCDFFGEILMKNFELNMESYATLWNKTENNLKFLIKKVMEKNYGIDYLNFIKNKYKNEKFLKDANFYLEQEKNINKNSNSNYIDTLSTGGVFKLIILEWYYFRNVFKKNKEYWNEIFHLIRKIRNLYAHSRLESLNDKRLNYQKSLFIYYSKEINFLIEEYLRNY